MKLYTADSHVSHKNIIHYAKRPFEDVEWMNTALITELRKAVAGGAELYHAGDLAFDFFRVTQRYGPIFHDPRGKHFVAGNHDQLHTPAKAAPYLAQFETVVGPEMNWAVHGIATTDVLDGKAVSVLVSHKPQQNLWGCEVNVFGHVHNNVLFPGEGHHPEDDWAFDSDVHFCACVELHDFTPVTLQQLADEKRAGYPKAHAAVERYHELHPNPPTRGT